MAAIMQVSPKESFRTRSRSASRCTPRASTERFILQRAHTAQADNKDEYSLFRVLLRRQLFGCDRVPQSFRYSPPEGENTPQFPLSQTPTGRCRSFRTKCWTRRNL